jgi:hypothetical protein
MASPRQLHPLRLRLQRPSVTIRRTVQGAVLLTAAFYYFIAFDTTCTRTLASDRTFHRSLASFLVDDTDEDHEDNQREEEVQVPAPVDTAQEHRWRALQEFLETGIIINKAGKETVRDYFKTDDKPLRHVRFSDLILPDVPRDDPTMKTAYSEATVISQSPWFQRETICNDTCCARQVAVSMKQDDTRIINAVDGQDVADVLLFGHSLPPQHRFVASELTLEIIPCLQPGVIIHADSYR